MTERYEINDIPYDEIDWPRFEAQEDAEYQDWLDYWNGLTDDERAREQQKMDAYVEECRVEGERRGHDV